MNYLLNKKYEVSRTPQWVIDLLINDHNPFWYNCFVNENISTFLDPSAGDSRILNSIKKYFESQLCEEYLKVIVNNDIILDESLQCNKDYDILHEELRGTFTKFDMVITNPPFTKAEPWVKKIHQILNDNGYCVFLQRLNWLGTKARSEYFKNAKEIRLKYVLLITKRPTWEIDGVKKNQSDTCEYVWFCFQKGYDGLPQVNWL